jgi:hypothetical protein
MEQKCLKQNKIKIEILKIYLKFRSFVDLQLFDPPSTKLNLNNEEKLLKVKEYVNFFKYLLPC